MDKRVAVVGGTGKTGRAVASALAARGAEAVPLGRAAWIDLAGALAGCRVAYVIAPNMHHDEAAYVESVAGAALRAGVTRLAGDTATQSTVCGRQVGRFDHKLAYKPSVSLTPDDGLYAS